MGGVSVQSGGGAAAPGGPVHYHLKGLREFKIHGGFVASGDAPISYSNLKFQMDDGRDSQKFTEREIMSGVIRAIKPNSVLRQYLESERNMGMKDFLQHIKNHYKLSNSGELLTSLAASVQGPDQSVQEYIDQVARLRNDIITISQEEGKPIDAQMVKDRYLHAITVGLMKETVRLEIQSLVKSNPDISDVDLGAYVQKVVARETEHEKKMEEARRKSKGASVNKVATGEHSEENQAIFNELGKIAATVNEISTTKSDEISELKQQMFLLQNRQEELCSMAAGGNYGYWDPGWQGQDGTTYYNTNNNNGFGNNNYGFSGFAGNTGGGQMNRGYGNGYSRQGGGNNRGNFSNNRGNFSNNRGNRGNFSNNRGGHNGNQQNVNQNQQNQKNLNKNNGNQNQQNNGGQQVGSGNRGGFNGGRGGRGGNRGGFGNRGRGGHNGSGGRIPVKCQECQLSGAFCTHCSNCGDANHKYRDCPEN